MDVYLVGILTFFAVLIGGLVWWSNQSVGARRGLPSNAFPLQVSPEAIIEMQLEEILQEKQAAAPDGNSFQYPLAQRDAYEELKASLADAPQDAADETMKKLQSGLMQRCIDCLQSTMTFDARVKLVYESYNNLVPREVLAFLGQVKTRLTDEIELIKQEANTLKPQVPTPDRQMRPWGDIIFNQAMAITHDLQRRKEARMQAEAQAQSGNVAQPQPQAQTQPSAAATAPSASTAAAGANQPKTPNPTPAKAAPASAASSPAPTKAPAKATPTVDAKAKKEAEARELQRQQREADRAFQELMKEEGGKAGKKK